MGHQSYWSLKMTGYIHTSLGCIKRKNDYFPSLPIHFSISLLISSTFLDTYLTYSSPSHVYLLSLLQLCYIHTATIDITAATNIAAFSVTSNADAVVSSSIVAATADIIKHCCHCKCHNLAPSNDTVTSITNTNGWFQMENSTTLITSKIVNYITANATSATTWNVT